VATIQLDIDESLLERTTDIAGDRAALSSSAAETRALDLLARPPGAARYPPLHEHPSPRSALRYGAPRDAELAEEEEEYAVVRRHRRVDADEDSELERALSRGRRSIHWHKCKRKKRQRQQKVVENAAGFANI
jgi:hypothetical protein